ncbi:MAG: isoleucine--tRNA ligase, partial [Candidatus Moranbacteria bacterium]|nr:isoleucine--tRNA ligase [Candidatus Moranbacteria bacterium]
YWTMRGYYVERKWGWDCHGLPIENIVEKEMGSKKKKDIEEMGVEKFNNLCRSKVLTYVDEWERVIGRLGRWADMKNAYRTMDKDYMESVWWVFRELWDRGLIYEDYRSMHICPRCETTLSQSEVTEGYKDIKDLSVIAKFELDPTNYKQYENTKEEGKTYILAWTTTPWTLPGNVALAVGENIEYVKLKIKPCLPANRNEELKIEEFFVLAKERVGEIFKSDEYEIIEEFEGKKLIGKRYKPLFDNYFKDEKLENRDNGWQIYAGDFVTTDEGTGVVHIAPAFGEDDMRLGKEKSLPFIQHVAMDGNFKEEMGDLAGLNVKPIENHQATDIEIIKYLAKKGTLFSKEKYEHSYPHCWRCDTPLINYATSSWFVAVTKIKDTALKSAKNINWSPANMKEGRFGNWLDGARDWSISRQRFWASAMPIWVCEKCGEKKVIGSIEEIREGFG